MVPNLEQITEWLQTTGYNTADKQRLLDTYDAVLAPFARMKNKYRAKRAFQYFVVNLFCKEEHYGSFKHARGIWARDDVAKLVFGPWVKEVERNTYHNCEEFIKTVPVSERAKHIFEECGFPGGTWFETDFSSFESTFEESLMEVERTLFEHVLGWYPEGAKFVSFFFGIKTSGNYCKTLCFMIICKAMRMSGEMDTSLSNGFANMMFLLYAAKLSGVTAIKLRVEGDDGLGCFQGGKCKLDKMAKILTQAGMLLKFESAVEFTELSFCGIRADSEELQQITDPYKVLGKFGWTNSFYLNASKKTKSKLLRCKALSFLHQYPACPIVSRFAEKVLELTDHVSERSLLAFARKRRDVGVYDRTRMLNAIKARAGVTEIGAATRMLFERQYGISPDSQRLIETDISSFKELGMWRIPLLLLAAERNAPDMVHMWNTYVRDTKHISRSTIPRSSKVNAHVPKAFVRLYG
jgi:hypothetical protein